MRRGFKPVFAVQSALNVGGPNPVAVLCGDGEELAAVQMVIEKLDVGHRVTAKTAPRAKMPTENELKELRAAEKAAKGEDPHKYHRTRREAKRARLEA